MKCHLLVRMVFRLGTERRYSVTNGKMRVDIPDCAQKIGQIRPMMSKICKKITTRPIYSKFGG